MRLLITVGRMRLAFSLQHLFQLVSNKLNLGSDNDLNAVLTGTDYAGNTCALDLLLIHQQAILDLHAQTGDAVIGGSNVVLAAQTFQNDSGDLGVVVIGQSCLHIFFLVVVIFTARSLQIQSSDGDTEHEVEDHSGYQADGDQQQAALSIGSLEAEEPVNKTGGEPEACAEGEQHGDTGNNARTSEHKSHTAQEPGT